MHILCSDVGVEAGLSRFHEVAGLVAWTLPERETIIVLEGRAKIEIAPLSIWAPVISHLCQRVRRQRGTSPPRSKRSG